MSKRCKLLITQNPDPPSVNANAVLNMEGDVDQAHLKIQLLMIPDMIKTAFDGSIKKVTIMRTLTDAIRVKSTKDA